MNNLLYAGLALVSFVISVFSFMSYKSSGNTSSMMLVIAGIFLLLGLGCGAMFLAGRVNRTEDIHITE